MKALLDAMDRNGWGAVVGCWGDEDSIRLRNECELACENGDFKNAGEGRGK